MLLFCLNKRKSKEQTEFAVAMVFIFAPRRVFASCHAAIKPNLRNLLVEVMPEIFVKEYTLGSVGFRLLSFLKSDCV